jgi:hypothetical protein
MDMSVMTDMLFGVLMVLFGVTIRRVFQLFDRLQDEDKVLHNRITNIASEAVSRKELNDSIDRVLNRIDKLEERLINGR